MYSKARAHFVKFQTFKAENLVTKSKEGKISVSKNKKKETQFEMLKI